MLSKAVPLGIEVDPAAANLYLPLPADPKEAIDTIHESWSLLWGFPQHRSIAANSTVSNSVGVRVAHVSAYRPSNLNLASGELANTYAMENVVAMPGMAVGAGKSVS